MSRRRRSGLFVPLVLTTLCVALAGSVFRKIEALGIVRDATLPYGLIAVSNDPLPTEQKLSPSPREAFSAIVERPIFSQSRRPAQEPIDPPGQVAAPTLDFDLAGIVIWRFERFALIRSKKDAGLVQVNEGGNVAGWEVIAIKADRVLLRSGESERELQLKYKAPQTGG